MSDDQQRIADIMLALGVGAHPARLMLVLYDARGRILPITTISERLRDYTGDYPTNDAIRTAIKRLRRGLRGRAGR